MSIEFMENYLPVLGIGGIIILIIIFAFIQFIHIKSNQIYKTYKNDIVKFINNIDNLYLGDIFEDITTEKLDIYIDSILKSLFSHIDDSIFIKKLLSKYPKTLKEDIRKELLEQIKDKSKNIN